MIWISLALLFSKILSFLSQIVLGHVLEVETYGTFAVVTTALALVAGFQNSGINKDLIRRGENYHNFYARYWAFTLWFGMLGMVIMVVIGSVFSQIYPISNIFGVAVLASTTVPLMALASVMSAPLNIAYKFRTLNLIEMQRALCYYLALIAAACIGFEAYSIAFATFFGAFLQLFLIRKHTRKLKIAWLLPLNEFWRIFIELRWLILAAFLVALSMRSDLLVLGSLFTALELGYYSFGFLLMTSITIPISAGITQVFFPIFAQMRTQSTLFRKELLRFSNAIVMLGGLVCLIVLGMGSDLVHMIWDGKWDSAMPVIIALALVMPFRFLALIAATGLESGGFWKIRNLILVGEAALLCAMVAVGVKIWGMPGAIIASATQRFFSGIISFIILARNAEISTRKIIVFFGYTYFPFCCAVGLILLPNSVMYPFDSSGYDIIHSMVKTGISILLFTIMSLIINRAAFVALRGLFLSKLRKGKM